MQNYLDLMNEVLTKGDFLPDRTGTGTYSLFGCQLKYDLRRGFPAVTTKKLAFKAVLSELLWFIEGSGDERRLAEILHGTRDSSKKTIWTENAEADYWKPKAAFEGDLGRVYGTLWRDLKRYVPADSLVPNKAIYWEGRDVKTTGLLQAYVSVNKIDQVQQLIDGIKKDPYGRRHIISAWIPTELTDMALPPCHMMCQFHINARKELSCMMTQRSADLFLGVGFNIASYAILTHMVAQVTGYSVGELTLNFGNCHIYKNHVDQVLEQLDREPKPLPTLWLNPEVKDIFSFKMDDIRLEGYDHHPAIKAPMAV